MVNSYSSNLDFAFAALADPTRRAILARLARGPLTAGELARPLGMSKPAVTKHLKSLERAGLMKRRISGRQHYIELDATPLKDIQEWMRTYRQFWEGQFDALEKYLEETNEDFSADQPDEKLRR